jgi:hypothetical protein
MRMLIAIAFACTLLGAHHAASSGTPQPGARPAELSAPAAGGTEDTGLEDATQYVCQLSPLCQHASQCVAYCAGGTPVCFQGCCSCAS